jgi:hypothetical protein
MIETTTKIRNLEINEKNILISELFSAPSEYWIKHRPSNLDRTALQYGLTYHIQWLDINGKVITNYFEYFTQTKKILETVNSNNLGRVYWHKLMPAEKITKHKDSKVPTYFQNKFITRYQIYFDIPKDFIMMLDNKLVSNLQSYANTIQEFALQKNHYYENRSDTDFYILVFDFIEK